MSVAAHQCLTPLGRIDPAIVWPGLKADKVGAKLDAFIKEGDGLSSQNDEATKVWVYYRAKDEQYQRLVGMPSSVQDSDEGGSSYLWSQIEAVRQERDNLLAEFEDMLEAGPGDVGGEYTVVQSLR